VVLLDPKLKFDCHIKSTVNKAMRVLGLVKRSWWPLYNKIIIYLPCPSYFGILFFGLESTISSAYSSFCSSQFKLASNVRLSSYQSRLLLLNLPTLVNRRTRLGTILNSDSVELVNRLTFNVPVRLARNYYPQN